VSVPTTMATLVSRLGTAINGIRRIRRPPGFRATARTAAPAGMSRRTFVCGHFARAHEQALKEFALVWCFGCRDSIAARSLVVSLMAHPMSRNLIRSVTSLLSVLVSVAVIGTASAQPASGPVTLFNNVRVFDGKNHSL